MTQLEQYLRGLNPTPDASLVYGREYSLYRDGAFIGVAKWCEDENIGDSFQTRGPKDADGFFHVNVYVADYWEPISN